MTRISAVTALTVIMVLAAPVDAQERRYTLMERELEYLTELWPGDFDKREQLMFDRDAGKTSLETGQHMRVHAQIRRVDVPAFGDYVLYVEEYRDNDPSSIFRQRLYELSADEEERALSVRLHFLKTAKNMSAPMRIRQCSTD